MSREIKVTCDACDNDLTYTGNSMDYYLVLESVSKLPWYVKEGKRGGAVTDMYIKPPVGREHAFCGLMCLDWWRDRGRFEESLQVARYKAWEAEHGEDLGNGMRVTKSVPNDIRKAWDDEVKAAVIAKFGLRRERA